jgi:hypothetical protein
MIMVGVDVHKHSLTAVAVDEAGRQLDALETAPWEAVLKARDAPLDNLAPTSTFDLRSDIWKGP